MLDHKLELFIKVAETGSITEVADKLFVSQPAISKQIKTLEDELNVKLFHRDKRNGLVLTDVGERILLLAKQEADIDNRIYQAAFEENNFIGGKLRIASLPILSTTILSRILPIYRKKYPDVSIEIKEGSPREVRKMLFDYTVEIALSCSPFENLDYDVLIQDRMVGLIPPKMSNPPKEIDLRKGTDGLILCEAGSETVLEELAQKHRINFANSLLFQNAITVVNMVERGNGIGVLSKFTLDAISNDLKLCDVTPHFPIEIGVEAMSLNNLTPVAKMFYEILKQEIKEN